MQSLASFSEFPAPLTEATLRSVLDRVADGFVSLGRDGHITFVNETAVRLLGRLGVELQREEMAGHDLWELVPTLQNTSLRTECERALREQSPLSSEYNLVPSGLCLHIHAYPDANGLSLLLCDVTERKQAEDALRRSEARLAQAQSIAQLGYIEIDAHTQKVHWSDETFRVLGYEPQAFEPQAEHFMERVHPDDIERVVKSLDALFSQGISSQTEYRIVRPDGQVRWVYGRGEAIQDGQGQTALYFGTILDITARKLAEEGNRESEERFRATFEQAAVGIAHVGLDGRFLRANQKWCEITGYPLEELQQLTFQDITHPDDLNTDLMHATRLLSGELDSYQMEKRYLRGDGQPVWVNLTVSVRHHDDGTPHHFISVIEEISTRRRAEAAVHLLAQAGEKLGTTLDVEDTLRELTELMVPQWADCAGAQLFEEGRLRTVALRHVFPHKEHVAWELVRRFSDDPVANAPFLEQLRPGVPVLHREVGADFLVAPGAHSDFTHLMEALGPRSMIILPLMRQGANPPQLAGAFSVMITESARQYDETDLALLEEIGRRAMAAIERARLFNEAQAARDEAVLANRTKDEFLSIVSHELRTPLTPILGWISLLRGPLDEESLSYAMDVIERNVKAQVQIVDDILDTTRITAGKLRLDLAPVPVASLIENALETVQHLAQKKRIEIFTAVPPDSGQVIGDAVRLRQVVWNLLSNAVKFTPEDGRVEVQARRDGEQVEIVVRDNGIGILADVLPHIFERFRQADSSHSRHYGGLGLGLSIVRHLVEMHEGEIIAESDGENKGSTFTVRLPLLPPPVVSQPEVSQAGVGQRVLNGLRILVVDDDPDTSDLITVILQRHGAQVRAAASVQEAQGILRTWLPDILVSDLAMPEQTGYDLLHWLGDHSDPALRVMPSLAVSACTSENDCEQALLAGFKRHVSKPVLPADLVRAVLALTKL